jgi:porin
MQRHVGCSKEPQLVLLFFLWLTFSGIFAASAMADGPLKWQNTGSGDWGGARQDLADRGITFTAQYDFHFQYNTTGGVDTGDGWESRLVPELNVQLEPLLGLKGTEFQVSGAWNVGDDINEHVGAIVGPSTIFRPTAVRLYELYLGQYFIDEQVHLKVGRLGLGPFEYGYSTLMYDYMSAGYNSNPGAFFVNQPVTTFAFPVATWGARVLIEPKDEDYNVRLGVYNGFPRDLADADKNGVDFSLNLDKSTFLISEFAYKLNQDPADQGRPGNYKIGLMYDTGTFDSVLAASAGAPGTTKDGNFGFYVIGDQMLYRETVPVHSPDHPANWKVGFKKSHPTDQGLYAWGVFVTNPDDDINLAPYWVSGGLTYKGLINGRGADRLGIGFYHSFFSSDSGLDDETHIEVFYRIQFTSWLGIGPDIQYIVNPGGSPDAGNAFVLGLNLTAFF